MSDAAPRQVNRWIVALSVMFGTFMEVLDTTVVNVSLPHIAGNLSVSITEATWVLTSYLVSNAIVLPMTGWLAQVMGRKRLLQVAIFGFTMMLRKLIKDHHPDYIGVVLDSKEPTFRQDKFPEYKAHRKPMPDDLVAQLPIRLERRLHLRLV